MIKGLKPYAEYNESGQKWLGRALAPRNGNSIFENPVFCPTLPTLCPFVNYDGAWPYRLEA